MKKKVSNLTLVTSSMLTASEALLNDHVKSQYYRIVSLLTSRKKVMRHAFKYILHASPTFLHCSLK